MEDEWAELDQSHVELFGEHPDPLLRVRAASEALLQADAELRDAIAVARAVQKTWGEIGEVLGVSRQAAHQRFGMGHEAHWRPGTH